MLKEDRIIQISWCPTTKRLYVLSLSGRLFRRTIDDNGTHWCEMSLPTLTSMEIE